MVTVDEASGIVFSSLHNCRLEMISIRDSVSRILAETVSADRDFPPFNRVAMDGIAIAANVFEKGMRIFPIESLQPAGQPQLTLRNSDHCIEVMTGAVLPAGTDTVIRYEDLLIQNKIAEVKLDSLVKGQNVHGVGMDAKMGAKLLKPGTQISPAEVALMASVGKSKINVVAFPAIAIISTGDELVDIAQNPLPHQLRRSNVYAIDAALRAMSAQPQIFHLADQKQELESRLTDILSRFDILILSGGVSKGKFDFLPEVLADIGVTKVFHQVSQRPGKPFWFGKTPQGKTVFALPGNPVSTFLCFYRYIKPWLLKSFGGDVDQQYAALDADVTFHPRLTYFLQVGARNVSGNLLASPVPGGGSGDFANLRDVTGFLELPAEETLFKRGQVFPYFPFRN
jgi:molybdopterin molybdotransferase